MKRQIVLLLILLIGIAGANSENAANDPQSIRPSNNYITRNYKVLTFDKLNISTVADVYYTQSQAGSPTSVEVYGPDNIVDLIQLSIKDGELTIEMDKMKQVKNIKNMKITISSPELYALNFRGVGNIFIEDGLKSSTLSIRYSGVGNMKAKSLDCESLKVSATGVGDINLSGTAARADLSSDGVGNIEAFDLVCKDLTASVGGVGNISCHATQSIVANAKGIGNISYKGNPADKRLEKKGIGSINQK